MSLEMEELQSKLDEVVKRVEHLEAHLTTEDRPEPPWQFLIYRPHPWRRQLSIKGRNLTVGQLVSTVRANQLTPEQASANLDLPAKAIEEALLYYDQNLGLIQLEAAEERRRLTEKGYALEPADLSR